MTRGEKHTAELFVVSGEWLLDNSESSNRQCRVNNEINDQDQDTSLGTDFNLKIVKFILHFVHEKALGGDANTARWL